MRNAFSFVEVLVSILILSMVGMALLKFNAFNKHMMQKNIRSFENNLINSPLLYLKNISNYTTAEEVNLFDITAFNNLSDEDRRYLKSKNFQLSVKEGEKVFLFNDSVKNRYLQAYILSLEYNQNTSRYLLLEESQ